MVSVLDGSGHAIFSIQMHNAEAAEQGASNLYFVGWVNAFKGPSDKRDVKQQEGMAGLCVVTISRWLSQPDKLCRHHTSRVSHIKAKVPLYLALLQWCKLHHWWGGVQGHLGWRLMVSFCPQIKLIISWPLAAQITQVGGYWWQNICDQRPGVLAVLVSKNPSLCLFAPPQHQGRGAHTWLQHKVPRSVTYPVHPATCRWKYPILSNPTSCNLSSCLIWSHLILSYLICIYIYIYCTMDQRSFCLINQPTHPSTHRPTHPPTHQPTNQPTYLPTYIIKYIYLMTPVQSIQSIHSIHSIPSTQSVPSLHLSIYISFFLSACRSVVHYFFLLCFFLYLCISLLFFFLSVFSYLSHLVLWAHIILSISSYLSIYPSIHPSIYLSISSSVIYIHIYIVSSYRIVSYAILSYPIPSI